jgi:two-component system, sensor histidine kinase RegB
MISNEYELFQEQQRSDWIRLRTLVILRWIAIAGQMAAVFAAVTIYQLQFEVGLTVVAIGASIVANLFFTSLYPENRRLSEPEAAMMLIFDILQLGVLLFLTGGLYNPFALLLLGPVTIAATVLRLRSTFLLGGLSIGLITVLALWNLPLIDANGVELALPRLFLFGFWIALVTGVVFLSIYARQVTTEMNLMNDALVATQLALAREQKLTDLGGVVAAAAHEFGTPLATIKLVASELIDELADQPELRDDAALIGEQADRCRDILRSMGRAGKEDVHLRYAPLETVVQEAAEPHRDRGKSVNFAVRPSGLVDARQPTILRRPEIIHGLRNLIQNAVDFADSAVEVESTWTDAKVIIRIKDDGRGFPPSVIGRIGDPFVRQRKTTEDRASRPGYDGMGLGLFIAKTLLERSGARLTFANGERDGPEGAIVVVEWPRSLIEQKIDGRLGDNIPIEA